MQHCSSESVRANGITRAKQVTSESDPIRGSPRSLNDANRRAGACRLAYPFRGSVIRAPANLMRGLLTYIGAEQFVLRNLPLIVIFNFFFWQKVLLSVVPVADTDATLICQQNNGTVSENEGKLSACRRHELLIYIKAAGYSAFSACFARYVGGVSLLT